MSGNTIGRSFTVSTFGESHGPALGCIIDGCPPGLEISEAEIQADVDRRRTGTSHFVPFRVRGTAGTLIRARPATVSAIACAGFTIPKSSRLCPPGPRNAT